MLSNRTLSKLRTGARGWRAASELLAAFGADPIAADAAELERRRWVTTWTEALTRTVRHPGNHKYVWALQKRVRRHLPAPLPYPKLAA